MDASPPSQPVRSKTSTPSQAAAAPSPRDADAPLFRPEAVGFRAAARLGAARIAHSVPVAVSTLVVAAIVVATGAFVVCGQWARKESVDGFLEPDHGVIRVFPNRGGLITEIRVAVGDSVERDAVLFKVADLQALPDGADAGGELLRRLGDERAALGAAALREADRDRLERNGLIEQRTALAGQRAEVDRLIEVQIEQSALADRQLDALQKLHERGALATVEWLARREALLAIREKLQTSLQLRKRLDGEWVALNARSAQAPLEHAERLAELDAKRSALERAEVEVRVRRTIDVRAPVAGRVATLQRKVGETAVPNEAALTLIPNASALVGRLLIPTSAIGFVAPGQAVRIRFDAFPYQHFGVHTGVIAQVAHGVLFSGESYGPLRVAQPAYPATVTLAAQTMTAGARELPLQAGMLFKADIVLERRTLLEWLAEPLLAMRGRG